MKILSLASGSSGNCYIVSNDKGGDKLMIEAGLPKKKLKQKLWDNDIYLKDIENCLISHEHKDHSKSMEYLAGASTNILAPQSDEKGAYSRLFEKARVYPVLPNKTYAAGRYLIKPFDLSHDDIPTLGYMILHKPSMEYIFYATDSMYIKYKPKNINYYMIEINYQKKYLEQAIKEGSMTRENMRRVMKTHIGLDTALEFFKENDLSDTKEIWILHVSKRNANKDEIKQAIQEETGKEVYIA